MNSRILQTIFVGVLALAALAIAGVGASLLTRPAQAQGSGVAGMRQITVIGSGETKIAPDMATVQIGVETTAPTTQEALAQNNSQAQAIIDQIKQLGVAEQDIQTSGFNIYPTYDNEGRNVTGYTVSNTVSVTIRDLAQAGELLDQVVQAGANRVYGIGFGVSDMRAAQAEAREAAIVDARARAEQMAAAAGAQIGQVLVISESIGSGPVIPFGAGAAPMAEAANVPVQTGAQTISAQVQVTYELR